MSELGFELVKHGFAESGRDVANDASYSPAYRILSVLGSDDALKSQRMRVYIKRTNKLGVGVP